MNALPYDVGDYDVRGVRQRGRDVLFAPDELGDWARSAAMMAQKRFHSPFPGWAVYRTIVNGTMGYVPDLWEYAEGIGRALAASHRASGHRFVREPGPWMKQASRDAMFRCIQGAFPVAACHRTEQFGVSDKTYTRLRNALAGGFLLGLASYKDELYWCVDEVAKLDRGL